MAIGRRSMELRSGRAGGGALTAATLLEAEKAPTARVLCRTAFRNMLRGVWCLKWLEETIAIGLQLRGGEIETRS